jgi:hypothetical protein
MAEASTQTKEHELTSQQLTQTLIQATLKSVEGDWKRVDEHVVTARVLLDHITLKGNQKEK